MPFVYKDWEDLTIRDDFMFKAVMKNAELCNSLSATSAISVKSCRSRLDI